jgi:NTF2-related export protein 1/2
LNSNRSTISSFYLQPTATSPLSADISLNGNVIPDPKAIQNFFETQMPKAHYEVQSYDVQVLNPNYNIGVADDALGPDKSGAKMSLLILVSGNVRYGGEIKDAVMRGFTETVILVPNPESAKQKGRGAKGWLIQSQNFRLVL